jgi:hypothetical protein
MRSILIVFLVVSVNSKSYGQNFIDDLYGWCYSNQDTSVFIHQLDGIWQVGNDDKLGVDSTYSGTHILITDTAISYPVNDSSVIIFKSTETWGFTFNTFYNRLYGRYYCNTDSLNDRGVISISYDNVNWIVLHDPLLVVPNQYNSPNLTGNSGGWRSFSLNTNPYAMVGTTLSIDSVFYKFEFFSDSIQDTLEGIAFDELAFCSVYSGLTSFDSAQFTISPNPGNGMFHVDFESTTSLKYSYKIIDSKGIKVADGLFSDQHNIIDCEFLRNGLYFLQVTDLKSTAVVCKKIMVLN